MAHALRTIESTSAGVVAKDPTGCPRGPGSVRATKVKGGGALGTKVSSYGGAGSGGVGKRFDMGLSLLGRCGSVGLFAFLGSRLGCTSEGGDTAIRVVVRKVVKVGEDALNGL